MVTSPSYFLRNINVMPILWCVACLLSTGCATTPAAAKLTAGTKVTENVPRIEHQSLAARIGTVGAKATDATRPVEQAELPVRSSAGLAISDAYLREVISHLGLTNSRPFNLVEVYSRLSTNDTVELNACFLQSTTNFARRAMAWMLGPIGNAETVSIFTNSVIALAKLKQPDDEERNLAHTLLVQLGHLSSWSEEAFSFVRAGMKRSFWKSATGLEDAPIILRRDNFQILAEDCAKSVGLSGRTETPALLEEVKTWPLAMQADICSGVVEAAFNDQVLRTQGRKVLVVESGYDEFQRYSSWAHSEEGLKWVSWAVQVRSKSTAIPQSKRR